jgi:hypothetical protein
MTEPKISSIVTIRELVLLGAVVVGGAVAWGMLASDVKALAARIDRTDAQNIRLVDKVSETRDIVIEVRALLQRQLPTVPGGPHGP